jgi:hypothetical protein
MHPRLAPLILTALIVILCACRGERAVPLTGFIPDSVPLTLDRGDDQWSYRNPFAPLAGYKSVLVQPVSVMDDAGNAAEAGTLAAQFRADLIAAIGLPTAATTGPGVLVVRAAITGLKENSPLFNVAPQTQMRQRGYGYVAAEVYAMDGRDAAVVAACAGTQDTQRFSLEKLGTWDSAKAGLKKISDSFASVLKSK